MKPLQPLQIQNDLLSAEEQTRKPPLPEAVLFLGITLLILMFGLLMLYSTSSGMAGASYFKKQILWACMGGAGFTGVLFFGYKKISDISPYLMIVIFLMLALALCFPAVKGANRWIKLGPVSIQPSEYAKLIVVLFLAKFLSDRTRAIETFPFRKVFLPGGICCGLVIGMILLGRDLGTTVLLGTLFLAMLFAAGVRLLYILPIVLFGPPAVFFLVKHFSPVRWVRITTFLNPELTQSEEGYQLWHSFLALGSGNWFGIGFTESRMKQKYLPEAHTDFILSIVGEELGYVGLLLIILAYIVFVIVALRIAAKARTRQGMLIVFGILSFIALQAMINIGVISGAFPTKGMPAPFISYGGSNLVTCLTAAGFVFSVALDSAFPDYQERWHESVLHKLQQWFGWIRKKSPSAPTE